MPGPSLTVASANVEITGTTSLLDKAFANAEASLTKFEKQNADAQRRIQISQKQSTDGLILYRSQMELARQDLQRLTNAGKINPEVSQAATQQLDKLDAQVASLDGRKIDIQTNLVQDLNAKLNAARLEASGKTVDIGIDVIGQAQAVADLESVGIAAKKLSTTPALINVSVMGWAASVANLDTVSVAAHGVPDHVTTDLRVTGLGSSLSQLATFKAASDAASSSGGTGVLAPALAASASRSGGGGGFLSGLAGGLLGGGGGGGGAGLGALIHVPGGPFGLGGLTLGTVLGLGPEHLLTAGASVVGSGLAAVGGAGVLATGALGSTIAGGGPDAAVLKSTAADVGALYTAYTALTTAVTLYGASSTQAAAAQAQLNFQLLNLGPASAAELALAKQASVLNTMWDKVTVKARTTVVAIGSQFLGIAQQYVGQVGAFAARNFGIIQTALQPLIAWLKSPAFNKIWNDLEDAFAKRLPYAIGLFTNFIELLLKVADDASKHVGGLIMTLDKFFTRWNNKPPAVLEAWVNKMIADFDRWKNLLVVFWQDFEILIKHGAGTGNNIVVLLTQWLEKWQDWAQTVKGSTFLTTFFKNREAEMVAFIGALAQIVKLFLDFYKAMQPLVPVVTQFFLALEAATKWLVQMGQTYPAVKALIDIFVGALLLNRIGLLTKALGLVALAYDAIAASAGIATAAQEAEATATEAGGGAAGATAVANLSGGWAGRLRRLRAGPVGAPSTVAADQVAQDTRIAAATGRGAGTTTGEVATVVRTTSTTGAEVTAQGTGGAAAGTGADAIAADTATVAKSTSIWSTFASIIGKVALIIGVLVGAWQAIKDNFAEAGTAVASVGKYFNQVWQALVNLWGAVKNLFGSGGGVGWKDLLWIVQKFFEALGAAVVLTFVGVLDALAIVLKLIINGFEVLVKLLMDAGQGWQYIIQWAKEAANWVSKTAVTIAAGAVDIYNSVTKWFGGAANWVVTAWNNVIKWFEGIPGFFKRVFDDAVNAIVGAFSSVGNDIAGIFTDAFDGVKTIAGDFVNAIIGIIDSVIKGINVLISGINSIPLLGFNIKPIGLLGKVKFDTGGYVGGTGRGDTVAAMLEPGEYVIKKDVVTRVGKATFDALNFGTTGTSQTASSGIGHAAGGIIGPPTLLTAGSLAGANVMSGLSNLGGAYDTFGNTVQNILKGLTADAKSNLAAFVAAVNTSFAAARQAAQTQLSAMQTAVQNKFQAMTAAAQLASTNAVNASLQAQQQMDKNFLKGVTGSANAGQKIVDNARTQATGVSGAMSAADYFAGLNTQELYQYLQQQAQYAAKAYKTTAPTWTVLKPKINLSAPLFPPLPPFEHTFAYGGRAGPGERDSIPIMAAPGEVIINRHQENALEQLTGVPGILDAVIGAVRIPHFMALGGRVRHFASGGQVQPEKITTPGFLPHLINTMQDKAASGINAYFNKLGVTTGQKGGGPGPIAGTANALANQAIARSMLGLYGWGSDQMLPLLKLWTQESGWSQYAMNIPGDYGAATGIPQADPGTKLQALSYPGIGPPLTNAAAWKTDPREQITWGLNYIKGRYSTPAAAWAYENSHSPPGYARGGRIGALINRLGSKLPFRRASLGVSTSGYAPGISGPGITSPPLVAPTTGPASIAGQQTAALRALTLQFNAIFAALLKSQNDIVKDEGEKQQSQLKAYYNQIFLGLKDIVQKHGDFVVQNVKTIAMILAQAHQLQVVASQHIPAVLKTGSKEAIQNSKALHDAVTAEVASAVSHLGDLQTSLIALGQAVIHAMDPVFAAFRTYLTDAQTMAASVTASTIATHQALANLPFLGQTPTQAATANAGTLAQGTANLARGTVVPGTGNVVGTPQGGTPGIASPTTPQASSLVLPAAAALSAAAALKQYGQAMGFAAQEARNLFIQNAANLENVTLSSKQIADYGSRIRKWADIVKASGQQASAAMKSSMDDAKQSIITATQAGIDAANKFFSDNSTQLQNTLQDQTTQIEAQRSAALEALSAEHDSATANENARAQALTDANTQAQALLQQQVDAFNTAQTTMTRTQAREAQARSVLDIQKNLGQLQSQEFFTTSDLSNISGLQTQLASTLQSGAQAEQGYAAQDQQTAFTAQQKKLTDQATQIGVDNTNNLKTIDANYATAQQQINTQYDNLLKNAQNTYATAMINLNTQTQGMIQDLVAKAGKALGLEPGQIWDLMLGGGSVPSDKGRTAGDLMVQGIKSNVGKMVNAGKSLMDALAQGIDSESNAPLSAIQAMFNKLDKFLPHSDAEMGPLSNLTDSGATVWPTFATGMKQGAQKFVMHAPDFSSMMPSIIAPGLDSPSVTARTTPTVNHLHQFDVRVSSDGLSPAAEAALVEKTSTKIAQASNFQGLTRKPLRMAS